MQESFPNNPIVALCSPKYVENFGQIIRSAACFGVSTIIYYNKRFSLDTGRLPREFRMKDYSDVKIIEDKYFFDKLEGNIVPVAVEYRDNSESLADFIHPLHPLYLFGPEDGSIPQVMLRHCHRFIQIPSKHCLNLAHSVSIVLYDRIAKLGIKKGDEII